MLKDKYVHFAIPCYGGQLTSATFVSFVSLTKKCMQKGLRFTLNTFADSLVTRARNNLVASMMSNPLSTHLMFIDGDIRFNPDDIFKLLEYDFDVSGGLCPRKQLPIKYVLNHAPKPKKIGSCIEVRHLGTGFMLIKRNVFERLFEVMPHLKIKTHAEDRFPNDEFYYALFDTALDANGYYLSEDWTFCDMVRSKLGISIWADTSMILDHFGQYTYCGNLELLQKEVSLANAG